MRKNILIMLLTFVSIASSAVTKSEFLDIIGDKRGFGGLAGYIELYKDGTGFYSSDFMAAMGGIYELGNMIGLGTVDIECDGAVASCNYRCKIALKWQFSNGKVTLKYTKVSGRTDASIVEWKTPPYASSTVDCVKQKLRKKLAEDKAMVGGSDVFEVSEVEHGQYGLQVLSDDPLAKLMTFIMVGSYSRESSSSNQSSYTVKEPVIVEATYPDGEYSIKNYVSNKLTYPAHLRKSGYSKTASYTLTISSDGRVSNAWSSDDVDSKLERSTKQLLMNLPKRFKSKTIDGKKVEGVYSIKIPYYVRPAMEFDVQKVNFKYTGGEEKIRVSSAQKWELGPNSSSNFTFKRNGDYIIIYCPERNKYDYDQISEKLTVYTADKVISYDIKISQEGAPKPYIKPSKPSVVLSHSKKSAHAVVDVSSNREWNIINHSPESKIEAQRNGNQIIFTSRINRKKYGEDATFTIESVDKDCQANILVHQNSKQEDENSQNSLGYRNSGIGLWVDYYDNYGKFELGILSTQVGLGLGLPIDTTAEPYFPINLEVGTLRFRCIELSVLNFRLDFTIDGLDGFAWEPQVRGLFPVSDRWALLPYVGPVCQSNPDGQKKTEWSASGGMIARVRYGRATHSDFSIGYKGGPCGGLAIGVSIGWSLGW